MSFAFSLSILPSLSLHRHPRKPRRRTTFIVLVALICLSTYICFFTRPQLAHKLRDGAAKLISTPPTPVDDGELHRSRLLRFPKPKPKPKPSHPKIALTESQELASLTFFLASLPENQIPANIDPSRPIDPELVLDFDTRNPRAAEGVREVVEEVWRNNPVVVFSKLHSPSARDLKKTLAEMNLSPPPIIFEVDTRADANVLQPLLHRLTSTTTLPILLVGGKPIPNSITPEMLKSIVGKAGAVVGSGGKKKKGRRLK
jgi:hypothetical protein